MLLTAIGGHGEPGRNGGDGQDGMAGVDGAPASRESHARVRLAFVVAMPFRLVSCAIHS